MAKLGAHTLHMHLRGAPLARCLEDNTLPAQGFGSSCHKFRSSVLGRHG